MKCFIERLWLRSTGEVAALPVFTYCTLGQVNPSGRKGETCFPWGDTSVRQPTEAFRAQGEMRAPWERSSQSNRYGLLQRSEEQAGCETSKGVEGQNSCKETALLLPRKTLT